MSIGHDNGPQLSPEQQSLCERNIALLKAQKEKPLKMPALSSFKQFNPQAQKDYKPRPLASPVLASGEPSKRQLKRANAAKYEAMYGRRAAAQAFEPVRLTSIAPPPIPSLLDGAHKS